MFRAGRIGSNKRQADVCFGDARKLAFGPLGFLFFLVASTVGAQAACSVPNPLTNFTTADANAVMGNFTSLAACAAPLASPVFTTSAGVNGSFFVSGSTGQYASSTVTSHGGVNNGWAAKLDLINTDGHAFELNMADSGGGNAFYTEF